MLHWAGLFLSSTWERQYGYGPEARIYLGRNVGSPFPITGILTGMLLPAVQMAREAARRTQCMNNLKQIGLGTLQYESNLGHYPSGGWGTYWVGMPSEGTGPNQPGGWIYNILPYVEQIALHSDGLGETPEGQEAASARRLRTPVALFNCPSRRRSDAWHCPESPPHLQNPYYTDTVLKVARSDYAINFGNTDYYAANQPANLAKAKNPKFNWIEATKFTGISFQRSRVTVAEIRDGLSNTILVGEKHLKPSRYYNGADPGDNESMYGGYGLDLNRPASQSLLPARDHDDTTNPSFRFGSAHVVTFHAVFCDGAVRKIAYAVRRTGL